MHYHLKVGDDLMIIKCGGSPEQKRILENRNLRHFSESPNGSKIVKMHPAVTPPHVPATTIPNLLLIYPLHLTSPHSPHSPQVKSPYIAVLNSLFTVGN